MQRTIEMPEDKERRGKAYNPKGFESGLTGKFMAPGPAASEAERAHWANTISSRKSGQGKVTYEQAMERLKHGEGGKLGHYVYEMMYDIYAGIENKFMEGAWDTHLHIYPDYVPRKLDMVELGIEASKAKMAGVVCKDHFFGNFGAAWGAQRVVNEMVERGELEAACKVLGTYIFAWSHHPDQVNLLRKYPNVGAIFFRTMTGGGALAGPELPIVDEREKILPEVRECIRLCAEYEIPIMTGHVGVQARRGELMALVTNAHDLGAHILVTHSARPEMTMDENVEKMKEMSKLGAYLEVNGTRLVPNMMHPCVDPNEMCDIIKAVGPENCILNTDWGQPLVYDPVDGLRICIRMLIHYGFSDQEITNLVKTNPSKYLYAEG